jgi:THO complex subunit 1
LQLSDISFRRNVLVQALIALDFLLSLSPKAKEKLSTIGTQNKSVIYADQVLSDDDTKWANDMKKTIGDYIRQSHPLEGPYFLRMVESVLVRDKNWTRWKMENCQPIERPSVSPREFSEAKGVARKMATNKRPYSALGALSLDFLTDDGHGDLMHKFRSTERCERPDLMSYRRKIADDDFEIEMPTNNQTRAAAVEGKASKSWRALRLASQYRLSSFDRIDNQDKIDAVFEEAPEEVPEEARQTSSEAAEAPEDRRPVVLVGPSGVGKSELIQMLLEKNAGVFEKVPAHATRKAQAGEKDGKDYYFVEVQAFNMMRDGDQFLQYTDSEGANYATSRKAVDGVSEAGKVPILVMDQEVSYLPPTAHLVAAFY